MTNYTITVPPPSDAEDASMAFVLCLILMGLLVVFMVFKVPKLLALFGTSSEWINGIILRHATAYPLPRIPQYPLRNVQYPPSEKDANFFDDPKDDIVYQVSYTSKGSLALKGRVRTNARKRYPPHISSCIKPLRPFLKPFRRRVSPGFSLAQLLILSVYLAIVSASVLYNSNLFIDHSRTAWIAVSQFPFLYAFAQKNNIIGGFLGLSYEKLNFVHRFAGRLVVLAANMHGFHFLYLWAFEGVLWKRISVLNGQPMWGIMVLLCIDSLYLFSTPYIRNQAYNLFFRAHIVAIIALLPVTYMHKHATLPYIFACTGIYGFDRLVRILRTRFARAYIRPLPELDVTRVQIPRINAGWRAGQHVRLRVLTFQLGWFGWAETHPFTISSVSRSPDGIVLLCKRAGDWTRKLYDMARVGNKLYDGARVNVVVEGPYGGPGNTIFSSFSAAVLVAGGSGITYCLPILEDLVMKDLNNESRVKVITLVWAIADPSGLVHLLPKFSALVQQATYIPLRINIYYTGPPTGNQPSITQALLSNMEDSPRPQTGHKLPTATGLPPGITMTPGRPEFPQIFDEAIRTAVSLGFGAKDDEPLTGLVVGVCGPVSMVDDVSKALSSIDPVRRDRVGGIEICEEVFGM